MPSLNIVLGLRYENFGQPANTLTYPAFAGFDPDEFTRPNRVNLDNNNFGPAVGLAWSPSPESGWMARLFGDGKTVLRAGFQISYDAFFTQMIALGPSTSTPNASSLDRTVRRRDTGGAAVSPTGRNSYQLNAGHHRFLTHRTACLKKTFALHTRSDGPLVCRDNFLLVSSSKEHTSALSATSSRHAWTSIRLCGRRVQASVSRFRTTLDSYQPGQFGVSRYAVACGTAFCARFSGRRLLYVVEKHRQHQRRYRECQYSILEHESDVCTDPGRRHEARPRTKRFPPKPSPYDFLALGGAGAGYREFGTTCSAGGRSQALRHFSPARRSPLSTAPTEMEMAPPNDRPDIGNPNAPLNTRAIIHHGLQYRLQQSRC